jgi:hypothetical protein
MARRPARERTIVSWEPAEGLKEFAAPLIEKYHGFLQGAPLQFTWISVSAKVKSGKQATHRLFTVPAKVIQNCSDPRWQGKDKIIFIEIPKKAWDQWSPDKRMAVLDMALMRIQQTPKGGLRLIDLDFGDVVTLLNRHGAFDDEMQRIVKAAAEVQHQLAFDDDEPANEELEIDLPAPIVTGQVKDGVPVTAQFPTRSERRSAQLLS